MNEEWTNTTEKREDEEAVEALLRVAARWQPDQPEPADLATRALMRARICRPLFGLNTLLTAGAAVFAALIFVAVVRSQQEQDSTMIREATALSLGRQLLTFAASGGPSAVRATTPTGHAIRRVPAPDSLAPGAEIRTIVWGPEADTDPPRRFASARRRYGSIGLRPRRGELRPVLASAAGQQRLNGFPRSSSRSHWKTETVEQTRYGVIAPAVMTETDAEGNEVTATPVMVDIPADNVDGVPLTLLPGDTNIVALNTPEEDN